MKPDLVLMGALDPVPSEESRRWQESPRADEARRRAIELGTSSPIGLADPKPPRVRWPIAIVTGALVLLLAAPVLLLTDQTTVTTTSIQPGISTLVPTGVEPYYTAVLECVAQETGSDFGVVTIKTDGTLTTEGQQALDAAAEAHQLAYTSCFGSVERLNATLTAYGILGGDWEASIAAPAAWTGTPDDLTPSVVSPQELISFSTYPLVAGGDRCAHLPVQALEDLGPDDVLIQVLGRPSDAALEPAPPTFAGRVAGIDESSDAWECVAPEERTDLETLRWIPFELDGIAFYVLIALGTEAGEDALHWAEIALDSLSVEQPEAAGWAFTEIPFDIREGSGYATGAGWLFVWSGAPDRTGDMRRDGLLVNIDTGEWRPVPEAPIEGRYGPAVVWTGSEFIAFGGQSFDASVTDGAAFDPVANSWRVIGPTPLEPAPAPTAVWTGEQMLVWLAGEDSDVNAAIPPTVGQLAAYDPTSDTWVELEAPPISVRDAFLILDQEGDPIFIGGPEMKPSGALAGDATVVGALLTLGDPPSHIPVTDEEPAESARAFISDLGPAVLRDDGQVRLLGESAWTPLTAFGESCWYDVGATSGGGNSYLRFCGANYQLIGSEIAPILAADDYGAWGNTYGTGFVATDDGRLVTLGDSDQEELASGTVIFGVFEPGS